ncbi:unnamed protein product [Plutella xylostella]|uniref:(diamondback moth) hypothetical protein n=1 Tax=Plutella xylostella TaxID=51655 RepID=A0A8S4G784_PLUXY|nr:unnamed protein product [Plutella xylostella]
MSRNTRVSACVAALLLQVNVLLAAYAGAGLLVAARLWWDPSLAAVTRAVWPREHAASSALLPALAAALLLLAHAAAAAPSRRHLLHLHLWGTLAVLVLGGAWLGWLAARLRAWAGSPAAAPARDAAAAADHLQPLLDLLAKYLPVTDTLQDVIKVREQITMGDRRQRC